MIDYLKLSYFQEIAIIFVSKTRISVFLYLNIICPLEAVDLVHTERSSGWYFLMMYTTVTFIFIDLDS